MKEIILPTDVTTIGDEVFAYCDSLAEITIPNNVTTIGKNAFPEDTVVIYTEP